MKKDYVNPPKEVIIVEGRDDTKRLIETFGKNVKTIETNGSAIDEAVLDQIKAADKSFGVIVMTDPDFQGERIRRIIEQAVPTAKHAHVERSDAQAGKIGKSLGIEHVRADVIVQALEAVMTPSTDVVEFIKTSELIQLQLIGSKESTKRRDYIAKVCHLGHINGKQLQKKLALYQINYEELKKLLKEGEDNGII